MFRATRSSSDEAALTPLGFVRLITAAHSHRVPARSGSKSMRGEMVAHCFSLRRFGARVTNRGGATTI
eukprot:1005979-Prymnesium_polylepis.1